MAGPPSTKAMLAGAAKKYEALRRATEAKVVRWDWATWAMHSLEPHYFERMRFAPGKRLRAEPDVPTSGMHQYGFDREDRLVLEREHTEWRGLTRDTFFVHGPLGVQAYAFDKPSAGRVAPTRVAFLRVAGGRPTEIEHRYAQSGASARHVYSYLGDRLVRVDIDGDTPHAHELVYDDDGQLSRVFWIETGKHRSLVYRRVGAGDTLRARAPEIRGLLLAAIERTLERLRLREPVYALALWMDMDAYEHLLPPGICIGLASERAAFVAQHGRRARSYVWNPVEWKLIGDDSLDLDDRKLSDLCEVVSFDVWQNGRAAQAMRLAREVAAELGRRKLPLATTQDFVCYVTDVTSGDGPASVRRSAPPRARAALAKRRLI